MISEYLNNRNIPLDTYVQGTMPAVQSNFYALLMEIEEDRKICNKFVIDTLEINEELQYELSKFPNEQSQ